MLFRSLLAAGIALLVACGDPPAPLDAALPLDAGVLDAGVLDAGPLDAGEAGDAASPPPDAGPGPDAGTPDAGPPVEGTISGSCGVIDTELFDPEPSAFENEITFPVRLTEADLVQFTEGTRDLLETGTVGGESIYSEAMAFEVLARCEGAELIAGEPDIDYLDDSGKRTDILVDIDGERVGVSVVRAVSWPRSAPYPAAEAERIISRKLNDIQLSTLNVEPHHRWVKQILHVMAYGPMHAELVRAAWDGLSDDVRGDTILFVTTTHGEDEFVYSNEL